MTERLLMYPCTVGLPRYSPRSQSSVRRLAPSTIPKFWARGLATDPRRVVTRARPARHVLVCGICSPPVLSGDRKHLPDEDAGQASRRGRVAHLVTVGRGELHRDHADAAPHARVPAGNVDHPSTETRSQQHPSARTAVSGQPASMSPVMPPISLDVSPGENVTVAPRPRTFDPIVTTNHQRGGAFLSRSPASFQGAWIRAAW